VTARGDEAERRPGRRRRSVTIATLGAAVFLLGVGTAATVRPMRPSSAAIELPPVVLIAAPPANPTRLEGVLVRAAARDWMVGRTRPLRIGDPVPVQLTAYCLEGTTRRDNLVREGIVAADPKLFPLGRYVDLYIGQRYHGRFLVDDTGSRIRDGILDIWTPSCRDARRFGRKRGTAVLVARPRGARKDTLLTGRLHGLPSH
jgi:3D (Asp-Asp-Asp) domain-containing protein